MASPSNAKFSLKAEELLQPEPGIKSGNAVAVSAQKEAGSGYLNTMVEPLSPNRITECLYTHLSSEEAARDVRRAFETVYMNRSQ